ncbi:MAG: YfcE family phosphodiesterase [Candidatus Promineifilaceae bacterium]|nr:YfcE family phosphodiesterase [Candidatus Promineifilaceae bacterium]
MRIGVLSDTHNHIGNLLKALRFFREEGIEKLIHCGDMVNVTTAKQMAGFDVIYVNGNMDDSAAAVNDALWFLNPDNETAGDIFTGKIDGVSIAATHGHVPGKLDQLIRSGRYDYIFCGHTHRRRDERIKKTRVINPGALGGARYEPRTVCVIDLQSHEVNTVKISNW